MSERIRWQDGNGGWTDWHLAGGGLGAHTRCNVWVPRRGVAVERGDGDGTCPECLRRAATPRGGRRPGQSTAGVVGVGRARRNRAPRPPTHDELVAAIRRFEAQGGQIQRVESTRQLA